MPPNECPASTRVAGRRPPAAGRVDRERCPSGPRHRHRVASAERVGIPGAARSGVGLYAGELRHGGQDRPPRPTGARARFTRGRRRRLPVSRSGVRFPRRHSRQQLVLAANRDAALAYGPRPRCALTTQILGRLVSAPYRLPPGRRERGEWRGPPRAKANEWMSGRSGPLHHRGVSPTQVQAALSHRAFRMRSTTWSGGPRDGRGMDTRSLLPSSPGSRLASWGC